MQASGKYIGCKCIPRVLCRWTRAQDEDDDDEDEHESSAPDRDIQLFLFPFTSVYVPRSLFAWTKYGHASTTPGICVRTLHIFTHTHIYIHTRICAPRTYPVAEKRITIFFSGLEKGRASSSVRRKNFISINLIVWR